MCYKPILVAFFLTVICLKAFPAVFVVTSNADSGPGTLREALTRAAANGGAQTDYINFNLPGLTEAGRTINLKTQLPAVTSKLVIDATTQPGTKIGISDATIILSIADGLNPASFSCFKGANADGIEIDGFYFASVSAKDTYGTAIYLKNITNLVIGKAGKGNVFGMVDLGIELLLCDRVTIAANLFGIDPNTALPAYTAWSGNIALYASNDILIGGDTHADGNIFVSSKDTRKSIITAYNPETQTSAPNINRCVFKNNTIGFKTPQGGSGDYLTFAYTQDLDVLNNIYNYGSSTFITSNTGILNIRSNRTNLDSDLNPDIQSTAATPFVLQLVQKAVIGGVNPGDGNIISNYSYPGSGNEAIAAYECNDVLVQRNSISCKTDLDVYSYTQSRIDIPFVTINSITGNQIKGRATNNSVVEVFSDNQCQMCEPTNYLGSVTAGSDGSWSFTVPGTSSGYTASASLNGRTSLFVKVDYFSANAVIKNPSCGSNDGSIKGMKVINATKVIWKDADGKTVSNNLDVDNLPPGTYFFTAFAGDHCSLTSPPFVLADIKPRLDDTKLRITPQCPANNGSIAGLTIKNSSSFDTQSANWTDASGKIAGSGLDLTGAPSGSYTFTIVTKDNCISQYGPVVIKSVTGPVINETGKQIRSTNCGETTGSITNISVKGTGNLRYSWKNSQQQEVGTNKDLTRQPGGLYTLEVTDDSQCSPVYSTQLEIPEVNGITLDESKVTPRSASCGMDNGSITGMVVTGNNVQYKWVDANNQLVSPTLDLLNAAPGDYYFIAYNSSICSKTSTKHTVGLLPPTQFPVYENTIVPACFARNNGSVNVVTDALVKSVRWVNSQGQTVDENTIRSNIAPGAYKLYLTDQNGCETFYNSYQVSGLDEFKIAVNGQVVNDECGLKTGGISGVVVTGGLPPDTYTWKDSNGVQIGSGSDISNLGAGTYQLNIADTKCGNINIPYTVVDQPEDIAAPEVTDVQLCSGGDALIRVNHPSATSVYRLYDDATSAQPLQQQAGGTFKVPVAANRNFYISQLNGTCESGRVQMSVLIGLSVKNIANAFSPNGDGINDYWTIHGIESYPNALVQVFTRYGQKVFESKGYSYPFDGTLNGRALDVGAYYYIINLSGKCRVLSGSLTIIR